MTNFYIYQVLSHGSDRVEKFTSMAKLAKHYGLGIARLKNKIKDQKIISADLNQELIEMTYQVPRIGGWSKH